MVSPSELSRLNRETIACALAGRSTRDSSSSSSCLSRLAIVIFLHCTATNAKSSQFPRFDLGPNIIVINFECDNPSFTVTLNAKRVPNFFGDRHRVNHYANLVSIVHLLTNPNMLHKFAYSFYERFRFDNISLTVHNRLTLLGDYRGPPPNHTLLFVSLKDFALNIWVSHFTHRCVFLPETTGPVTGRRFVC